MLTKEEARSLAHQHIQTMAVSRKLELLLLDEQTREGNFGWVFFYDSKVYVETGDISWALGGNAPILVDKHSGALHVTGTALPTKRYIEAYRRYGDCSRAHD